MWFLNYWAKKDFGKKYSAIGDEQKAALQARLKKELRINTYNKDTKKITISPLRVQAIKNVGNHYASLFTNDPKLDKLRILIIFCGDDK